MSPIIGFQESLRPALPVVLGCKDYAEEKQLLERVDRLLRGSGVEAKFLRLSETQFSREAAERQARGERVQSGGAALERYLRHSGRALRCTVLHMSGGRCGARCFTCWSEAACGR